MSTGRNKLDFLDSIRGLAAIYVLIGHSRWLLSEQWSDFQIHKLQYNLFEQFLAYFFLFFKYGHEVVIFFFILSGFVIHLKYAKRLKNNVDVKFDFLSYFRSRFYRIYPPYLFALILTYYFDKLVEFYNFSIYNHLTPTKLINISVFFNHDLKTFIGNLFFLQGTFIPIFGSNGPLWSLMYEWWFYMLYPFLYLLTKKNISIVYTMIVGVSLIFFLGGTTNIILIDKIFSYLFIWCLGVLVADIYVGRIIINKKFFFPLIILLILIPLYPRFDIPQLFKDAITSVSLFGLFMLFFHLLERKSFVIILLERFSFLGSFSYTLYVIHFPLLVFYNGLILQNNNNIFFFTQLHILYSSIVIIVISFFLSKIIEHKWSLIK